MDVARDVVPEQVESHRHAVQYVIKAKKYIAQHFDEDLTLEQVAQSVYLSPFYFSRLFKAYTGYTFNQYLTRLRLSRARNLLKRQDMTICEVALTVGYNNSSYFSRVFKEREGLLPSEYRKRMAGS